MISQIGQMQRIRQSGERIGEIRRKIIGSMDPEIIELGGSGKIGIYPKKAKNPQIELYNKDMLSSINSAKKIAQELRIELSKNPELMKSKEDIFVFVDEKERVKIHIGFIGTYPFLAKSAVQFIINQLKHLL